MKRIVKVVGAVVINEESEILCALRSSQMFQPNVWEFPGGEGSYGVLKNKGLSFP